MKKFYLKKYFEKRVLEGKVDIPYLELVLTTRCTLRCESCNNLMQYFSPSNQYTCTLEGIIESLELLLSKVDSIARVRIIGGEPLLFKDLPQLIDYLDAQKKILTFDILTNATIDFKEDLILRFKKSKKARK
ncbi:radical SAM protein [Campylobacter lari]|nr:radical SAM protein [Campylobacter lari]MCH3687599.1 4Fe-4S cluster-binding domain-containing protein [Campylobacter lari]MCH3696799.1 4Fe-4S cluster-binding domain-containing protein [Campylobacter lari]MCH3700622.1 4Fe-4S cluster-binding domain-containing protein [Campylobacter lari]MCH3702581.1 4Fe-4S cluster-binding domain-containing protein [Campylobacter lari]MCR2058084.1 4Fe-4S cluster-binding domain-containing protein [Campylobacter lari subsp. concheus]